MHQMYIYICKQDTYAQNSVVEDARYANREKKVNYRPRGLYLMHWNGMIHIHTQT